MLRVGTPTRTVAASAAPVGAESKEQAAGKRNVRARRTVIIFFQWNLRKAILSPLFFSNYLLATQKLDESPYSDSTSITHARRSRARAVPGRARPRSPA